VNRFIIDKEKAYALIQEITGYLAITKANKALLYKTIN